MTSEPRSPDVSPPLPAPAVEPQSAPEVQSAAEMPPDTSWIGFDLVARDPALSPETRNG